MSLLLTLSIYLSLGLIPLSSHIVTFFLTVCPGNFAYVMPFFNKKMADDSNQKGFALLSPQYSAASLPSTCSLSFKYNLFEFRGPETNPLLPSSLQLSVVLLLGDRNKTIFHVDYDPAKNGIWLEATIRLNSTQTPFQVQLGSTAEHTVGLQCVGLGGQ